MDSIDAFLRVPEVELRGLPIKIQYIERLKPQTSPRHRTPRRAEQALPSQREQEAPIQKYTRSKHVHGMKWMAFLQ